MRKFLISFTVTSELLPTVISLLTPEIGELSVREEGAIISSAITKRNVRNVTQHPKEKWRSSQVILNTLADGIQKTTKELGAAYVAAGYNVTGTGATVSRLLRDNKIRSLSPGVYIKA